MDFFMFSSSFSSSFVMVFNFFFGANVRIVSFQVSIFSCVSFLLERPQGLYVRPLILQPRSTALTIGATIALTAIIKNTSETRLGSMYHSLGCALHQKRTPAVLTIMPMLIFKACEKSLSVFVSWYSLLPSHLANCVIAMLLTMMSNAGTKDTNCKSAFSLSVRPTTKPQATKKLTKMTSAMAAQDSAKRLRRSQTGTPKCVHTMSPGSAACWTFTLITGLSPTGYRGSDWPGLAPGRQQRSSASQYIQRAQKLVHLSKHALWSH
mmetsp:Transcript_121972/g.304359  ORF Transcript_121972/g.304359 Transcript_121972/m.304359 type:complete len:265 (+) Transcript_121972:702-1496(+)